MNRCENESIISRSRWCADISGGEASSFWRRWWTTRLEGSHGSGGRPWHPNSLWFVSSFFFKSRIQVASEIDTKAGDMRF